jgi:hypothetical protein
MRETGNGWPTTEAICQTELLQVAALGYTFLGTSKDNNEKIVGPKRLELIHQEKLKSRWSTKSF